MNGFIAHTDRAWWNFHRARGAGEEVNFFRPRGGRFHALAPGEPFFFRLKRPVNKIAGYGLFARSDELEAWDAWETYGEANGTASEEEFLALATKLARRPVEADSVVGCVAVTGCVFFTEDEWVLEPPSFNPQNLRGARIDLETVDGRALWEACLVRTAADDAPPLGAATGPQGPPTSGPRLGRPHLVASRLGQGSFRLSVRDAYGSCCAVTGEPAFPALEAAHIYPWRRGGPHEVPNGILLRRDLHRLFDRGYLALDDEFCLLVSPQLVTEFGAGSAYAELSGRRLRRPASMELGPGRDYVVWHRRNVFHGVPSDASSPVHPRPT